MRLTLDLHATIAIALRKFASSADETPTDAAVIILIEYLTQVGILDLPDELDEDTETKGSA